VLSALARPSSGENDLLELTGVAMLAREHRRDAVRAGLRQDVRLVAGEVEHSATTLDLSSGGCRVQVADPSAFGVGEVVDVQLELDGEAPLTAAGQVVRSDQVAHEVAVRFLDLTDDDEAVLDALVYAAIGSAG
jgi:c-di-GMP-binding flagellar brake protein YcgR